MKTYSIQENKLKIESDESVMLDGISTGQRIRALRKRDGFSQKELAEKIGVTQSSIALWETDKTTPGYNNIRALAKALQTTAFSLCDKKTWDVIKAKLPKSETPTIEAAESDQYMTMLLESVTENIDLHKEHADLISQHIQLLQEHQKLLEDTKILSPITPLYTQLNERGQALIYGILLHIVQNPKWTLKGSTSEEAE